MSPKLPPFIAPRQQPVVNQTPNDAPLVVETCIDGSKPVWAQKSTSCENTPLDTHAARVGIDRSNTVRAQLEAKLLTADTGQANPIGLPPENLPTLEKAQEAVKQATDAVKNAAQRTSDAAAPYIEEGKKTLNGAVIAFTEDQFFLRESRDALHQPQLEEIYEQNETGRVIGHTTSGVVSTAEIINGMGNAGIGTLLDLTGVGTVPGVALQAIGVGEIVHGTVTGGHTIDNALHDPILNKNAEAKSGGEPPATNAQGSTATSSPQGKLEVEPGRTLSPQEQKIADKLVAEGKQVKVPKEIENQAGVRNPDFEVDGVKTELKTVKDIQKTDPNGLSAKLSQRISEAGNQASNVILDVTEQSGMTREIAERGVKRAFGNLGKLGSEKIQEVRIIGKDFDVIMKYEPPK